MIPALASTPAASTTVTPAHARIYDRAAAVASLGALLLALLLGALHRVGTYNETDFYWAYGPQAKNLLAGRPYSYPFHPPGYSLLVAAGSFLTDDLFIVAKVLSAIATGVFGWFAYLLVKALFDARLALATALLTLVAVLPFSFLAANDVVGATLMLLPLWVLLRRPTPTSTACLVTGMLAGAAYLVRTNAIAVTVGLAVSLLFGVSASRSLVRRLADCQIFLFGVLLTTAPWLAINWARQGQPFASANYLQVAAHFYFPEGENYSITSLQQAGRLFHSPWEVLSYQPLRLLRRYIHDTLYAHPRSLVLFLQVPAAVIAGVGFVHLVRLPSRRRLAWFITIALGYLLLGLTNSQLRFYLFLFPALFLLVASGLFQLARAVSRLTRSLSTPAVGGVLVAIFVAIFGVRSLESAQRVFREEPRHLVKIADFLRARSAPDDGMIVRKPHLAFLAGLQLTPFPLAESAGEFLEAAQRRNARYVGYSDREAGMWPGLKSLADPTSLPKDFRLIYSDEQTKTLVYEIGSVAARSGSRADRKPVRVDPVSSRTWVVLLLIGVVLGLPLITERIRRGSDGNHGKAENG